MTGAPCISVSRREAIAAGAVTAAGLMMPWPLPAENDAARPRPRVAAVFTEFRFRSHAWNILESFAAPYLFRGRLVEPACDVVSWYADQFPAVDQGRATSRRLGIPLSPSIDEALCLGGKELAVDAVLLIGEHGNYPFNELGQHLYPRKEFFDQIVAVMRRSNRFVPVFNDKHLSYRWDWAKEMYDTSRAHGFVLMAGSSVPLAARVPALELPADCEIEEAVSIHGGGLEVYDFHALEVLQSMVEARRGGETGIRRIQLLSGDAFRKAVADNLWSPDLVQSAMNAELALRTARPRKKAPPVAFEGSYPDNAHAIRVTYKDGLRATVVKIGSDSNRWNFACRLRGETKPRATAFFNGPWGNRCLFKGLSNAIQHAFVHRRESYPIERTLLTTGATEAAMRSHFAGNKPLDTPHLEFGYKPIDFRSLRENGDSWKLITEATDEPRTFASGDGLYHGDSKSTKGTGSGPK